ncbi:ATP11-domain-containing protein [Tuber magnatum]|uniref:ATP11-domain-containing protein n=1 Tax=Tuber magnatum TaxID=42249 RepID=A0A317SLE5_9PEZI|nr:ATP11-domain-containing protein [Tuber magnatum]
MASVIRPFITRRVIAPRLRIAPRVQRRGARVLNARFLQTPTAHRVLEKYREKLEAKIKSEGLGSLEELREVYRDKIERAQKESAPPPPSPIDTFLRDPSPPPPFVEAASAPSPSSTQSIRATPAGAPPPGVKTLSSFVDVDKLTAHSDPKEIEFIWRARFLDDKNSLCAVIPKDTYARLEKSACQYPMFVLPLPRDNGAEMHFLQWTFPTPRTSTVIFTSLAEYKLRGEFAVPHTTLSHHLELAEDKGIVLAQGAVTPDRGVTADDARWLVMALQKFYGALESEESGMRRRNLLEMFSKGDGGFRVESLIEEVEKWG